MSKQIVKKDTDIIHAKGGIFNHLSSKCANISCANIDILNAKNINNNSIQKSPVVYPFVVGPDNSDTTRIQEAIDRAVRQGASATEQSDIFIKSGTYNENLTMYDGINLIGQVFQGNSRADTFTPGQIPKNCVTLIGTITANTSSISNSWMSVSNMAITPITGSPITYTGNILGNNAISFVGCQIIANDPPNSILVFNLAARLFLSNCILNGTNSLIPFINLNGIFTLFSEFSHLDTGTNITTISGASSFLAYVKNTDVNLVLDASGLTGPLLFSMDSGFFNGFFTCQNDTTQTSKIDFTNSQITSLGPVATRASGNVGDLIALASSFLNCDLPPFIGFNKFTVFSCAIVNRSNNNLTMNISHTHTSGAFSDSSTLTGENGIQTTGNTPVFLFTVPLNTFESIIMEASIVGSNVVHNNTTAGTVSAAAQRDGGNIVMVGSPFINAFFVTGVLNVVVDVPTQSLCIQVSGLPATIFNWSCSYKYQKLKTNS